MYYFIYIIDEDKSPLSVLVDIAIRMSENI